jgi:hypothetical protein
MQAVKGCSIAIALSLAGCGFTLTSGSGGDDGVPDGVRITLTDDTAADFATNAGVIDTVIAPRGALEPDAFIVGGLKGRGFAGNKVADDSTYETVVASLGPELGVAYRQIPADWSLTTANRPRGLGIPGTDAYTILFTGEILLPPGPVTLETNADDRVIVQIALDGTNFGPKLFAHNAAATTALQVPASGWYPIRAAFGQAGGDADWSLAITPMGGAKITIDGQRLRARVSAERGLIASAFDGTAMLTPSGETAVASVDENYAYAGPGRDLPLASFDRYSMRFAGQVSIDTPGMYTFSADIGTEANDLFRIWIDGVLVANVWPPTPTQLTATLPLTAGWHDLLVDYGEEDLSATVLLRMSGPGIPDGPIDPQRLRPAVAFGLTAPFVAFQSFPLTDAGVVLIDLPLRAPVGAVIASVDFGFGLVNQRLSDLTIAILDCHGATTLPQLTTVAPYYYYAADTSCAGSPVVPVAPWRFRITDTVPGNDPGGPPSLYNPILVATYSGGDRIPFAPTFSFVSAPKPTPGAIGFAQVEITADLRGALLTFEMRTAAEAAGLASASWVPVESGAVPVLTASEWVQYRVAISGDGWKLASVDKVDLTYVVPAE